MPRARKAETDTVVILPSRTQYATVVDYRPSDHVSQYLYVWSTSIGQHIGGIHWAPSWQVTPTGIHAPHRGRVVRANAKLGDRGCSCQCCPHVRGFEDEPS